MASEVKTYSGTGADCSGSSGDTSRVLTLSNTIKTSGDGFQVHLDGLLLSLTSQYTVTHSSPNTTVTFLVEVYDDQEIVVNYFDEQYALGVSGVSGDFGLGPLADFGVVATRTPVTESTDFHGQKTYTDGVDEDINVVIMPNTKEYKLDAAGLTQVYDAIAYVKSGVTINKYDKITHGGDVYRVDSVSQRNFSETGVFQKVMLFFIDNG